MSTRIPSPNPSSDPAAPTRAALLALARWQGSTPGDGLPRAGASELAPPAAMFADAAWPAVRQRLLDQALAQPTVALQGRPFGGAGAWAGPVTHDLVRLLRSDGAAADESQEIDLVVRWWQAARQAGVAVDEDFGEVWREYEWLGVLLALRDLQVTSDPAPDQAPDRASDPALAAALAAGISRTALRYGPLKPLLRLLAPLGAAAPGAGYTF